MGVRADLKVPTIQQSISARRLGLLKRILDSNSEWLLGLIVASWDQQRAWATEVQKDLKWLARLETGVSPTGTSLLAQAKATTKKRWKTKVKTAIQAAIPMQGTEDDLENLEKFQQDALGSVGLKVGAPRVSVDWACLHCQKCFKNKQAMRMHEDTKHQSMHVAHADMPATNCLGCMWEDNTKEKAIRH